MKTVNIHGAKSSLSSRLAKLESDCKTIVVCRHGEPVGDLEPHRRARRIKTPPVLGKIKLGYDPVEPPAREEWPPEARLTHPAADKPQYYMPFTVGAFHAGRGCNGFFQFAAASAWPARARHAHGEAV